jgi:hypothetical protein
MRWGYSILSIDSAATRAISHSELGLHMLIAASRSGLRRTTAAPALAGNTMSGAVQRESLRLE